MRPIILRHEQILIYFSQLVFLDFPNKVAWVFIRPYNSFRPFVSCQFAFQLLDQLLFHLNGVCVGFGDADGHNSFSEVGVGNA